MNLVGRWDIPARSYSPSTPVNSSEWTLAYDPKSPPDVRRAATLLSCAHAFHSSESFCLSAWTHSSRRHTQMRWESIEIIIVFQLIALARASSLNSSITTLANNKNVSRLFRHKTLVKLANYLVNFIFRSRSLHFLQTRTLSLVRTHLIKLMITRLYIMQRRRRARDSLNSLLGLDQP